MSDYPSYLPCPQTSDYKGTIDFGLSSVTFNHGNKRRRRMASSRLERYDLTFVYTTQQLWYFQSWANQFGFDWHWMPIVSHFSGLVDPASVLPHRVRIISDLNIAAIGPDHFKVKLQIELDTATRPHGTIVPSGRWIVAKTPSGPSTPDWVIAKTPPDPSTDIVIAGSPALPAA